MKSEIILKEQCQFNAPRAVRAPVSPASPLGLRGRRPRWAAALAGGLLINAIRVRLCCGLRLPPPSRKPQRPTQSVYKNGWPLLPLQHAKRPHGRGKQSLSRTTLESGQKGKFFRRQKFALLLNKKTKNHEIFKENYLFFI
jgi:hypothetical protein